MEGKTTQAPSSGVLKAFMERRKRQRRMEEEEKEEETEPSLTEMEKQVVRLKAAYPDMVLLLECGYRMRLFGEDAETAARIMGVRTQRHRAFVEASVPVHRALFHAQRLVRSGLKVGIVRQTTSAAMRSIAVSAQRNARQPLDRDVVQVFTRGTIPDTDDKHLVASTNNEDAEDDGGHAVRPDVQDRDVGTNSTRFIVALVEETVETTTLFVCHVHDLSNQHEAALRTADAVRVGVFGYDVHTGEWLSDDFVDDGKRSKLREYLQHVVPIELVLPEAGISPLSEQVVDTYIEQEQAADTSGDNCLSRVSVYRASVKTPLVGPRSLPTVTQAAMSVLDDHFRKLKMESLLTDSCLVESRQRSGLVESSTFLRLSSASLTDLGIFKDRSNVSSVFDVLNHTKTAAGARRLREWLRRPLVNLDAIKARQEAVSYLAQVSGDGALLFEDLREHVLPTMSSSERLLQCVHMGRSAPSSVKALLDSLSEFDQSMDRELVAFHGARHLVSQVLSQLPRVQRELDMLLSRLSIDTWDTQDLEHAMSSNWLNYPDDHTAYQVIKRELHSLNEEYGALLPSYREQLGDPTLTFTTYGGRGVGKIITRVLIVTKDKLPRVPSDWLIVSSSKASVKYLPSGIRELLLQEEVLLEKKQQVVRAVWFKTLQLVDRTLYAKTSMIMDGLAELDALCSLAVAVRQYPNYVRPEFSTTRRLGIKGGRHPVVERHGSSGSNYIASDVDLTQLTSASMIVTGPNMGGKSTLLRMAGVLVVMAHTGSFVPADSMILSPMDAVLTRMHRPTTHIVSGYEELQCIATISQQVTSYSLVLLDEIGFGLTTKQAKALAISTVNYLVQVVQCFSLVTTHMSDVVDQLRIRSSAVVAVELSHGIEHGVKGIEPSGDVRSHVVYYYTTRAGVGTRSLPMEAAIAADLPSSIIKRAQERIGDQRRMSEDHSTPIQR